MAKKGRPKLTKIHKGINKKIRSRKTGKKVSFTKKERAYAHRTVMKGKNPIYLR